MNIAIIGAGGIGSTFAVQLVRAGHDVTLVARGARLAGLESAGGVATEGGALVQPRIASELGLEEAWDLVIVTVLAHQVDVLLPALTASKARTIMFMFNTFEPLARLRAAVGAERFAFGFPSILAQVDERGVLRASIQTRGLLTTVTDERWAELFTSAGIPSVVSTQMEDWLRSHVAAVTPFMLAVALAHARGRGIDWTEASELSAAMAEGFALVRALGHDVVPTPVALISRLPRFTQTLILWLATRNAAAVASGAAGTREARALVDAMLTAAPSGLPALSRVRPTS